jgi:hypothetical protein
MFHLAPEFWLLAVMSQYRYFLSHQPKRLNQTSNGQENMKINTLYNVWAGAGVA